MKSIGQIVSVFAIALGVGLLVAGVAANPLVGVDHADQVVRSLEWSPRDVEFYHDLATALKGCGAGFLALGILGLVVPWVNVLVYGQRVTAAPVAP